MEKFLHQLLRRLPNGAVNVRYLDGRTEHYGQGEAYCTVVIKDPKAINRIVRNVSLGFGEAYMKDELDIEGPIEQITELVRLTADNESTFNKLSKLKPRLPRGHSLTRQRRNIAHHYDLGNDFYKLWLDKSMTYSCAYFRDPNNSLDVAQSDKRAHILKKLQLQPDQSLLDIGCGWGYLLVEAAEKYGARGYGVTLSTEQCNYAKQLAKDRGVGDLIQIKLMNYRELPATGMKFDRVVSVGFMEHVGRGHTGRYFDVVNEMLVPGGLSVLHTIGQLFEYPAEAWIEKYIFPGGYIPSGRELMNQMAKRRMRVIHLENLRVHYAMTLRRWLDGVEAHKKEIVAMFDEEFYRMWTFYLASARGAFLYTELDLLQIVFIKGINNQLPLTHEHLFEGTVPSVEPKSKTKTQSSTRPRPARAAKPKVPQTV